MAEQCGCRTISFPAISTGAYRFRLEAAAHIAIREVVQFMTKRARSVDEVIFVQFGADAYLLYKTLLLADAAVTQVAPAGPL